MTAALQTIDVLRAEHRDLETMLGVLESAAARLKRGTPVRPDLIVSAIGFFERFGSDDHHAKEEGLFSDSKNTFVQAVLSQHQTDRAYLVEIRDAVERLRAADPAVVPRLASVLQEYVDLMREHIRIEESYFDLLIAGSNR